MYGSTFIKSYRSFKMYRHLWRVMLKFYKISKVEFISFIIRTTLINKLKIIKLRHDFVKSLYKYIYIYIYIYKEREREKEKERK